MHAYNMDGWLYQIDLSHRGKLLGVVIWDSASKNGTWANVALELLHHSGTSAPWVRKVVD